MLKIIHAEVPQQQPVRLLSLVSLALIINSATI